MTIISRRSFLNATFISTGALASPAFSGRPLLNQSRSRDAEQNARVWLEILRVRFQLWHYRDRLLPLLLRGTVMDADDCYLGFRPPHPTYMAAYRHATDHLIKAMPTNGDGVSIGPLNHDETVAPILSLSSDAKDSRDLYRQCESNSGSANYCHVDREGFRWDLRSMGPRFPQAMLDAYAAEIVSFMQGPRLSSHSILSVQNAEHEHLTSAFSTIPLWTFWNLILPLFHIAPKSSSALLTVRRGNAKFLWDDTMRPIEGSYLYSTQMSMLSSFIMEYFANNHFSRILRIAGLRETWGNWHGFMAGQILDVLYQKVIVLRRMAASIVE